MTFLSNSKVFHFSPLQEANLEFLYLHLFNPNILVLCTAPNKYKVVDPEGTIKARCCVDIVIRHTAPLPSNCNVIDKFRIHMQEHPTKQVMLTTKMYPTTEDLQTIKIFHIIFYCFRQLVNEMSKLNYSPEQMILSEDRHQIQICFINSRSMKRGNNNLMHL